eukprot:351895-Pleurochrysis_carterae.AAC.1
MEARSLWTASLCAVQHRNHELYAANAPSTRLHRKKRFAWGEICYMCANSRTDDSKGATFSHITTIATRAIIFFCEISIDASADDQLTAGLTNSCKNVSGPTTARQYQSILPS